MLKLDKKTLEKYDAKVKANNAKFKKLTLPQQRVALAKDVIAQLKIKKLIPIESNGYFFWKSEDAKKLSKLSELSAALEKAKELTSKFKDFLTVKAVDAVTEPDMASLTMQTKCEVCGIGSLFVSALEQNNKFKLSTSSHAVDECDELDCSQCDAAYDRDDNNPNERDVQVQYLKRWFDEDQLGLIENYFERDLGYGDTNMKIHDEKDPKKRLIMIMENIVSNNGKFDPSKGKHGDPDAAA